MELTDIAPLETWLNLEQEINRRSGLTASVFDTKGNRIVKAKVQANALCQVIKEDKQGQNHICSVAHQNLSAQAEQTKQPVIDACDAGIMKILVPIFVKGVFLGVAGGCGCLEKTSEVESFMIHKTIGLTEESIQKLADTISCIVTPQQAESCAKFIQDKINSIVNSYVGQ